MTKHHPKRHRQCRRSTSLVSVFCCGAIVCLEYANAGKLWEPIASIWPGNLLQSSPKEHNQSATPTRSTPGPPSYSEKGPVSTSKGESSPTKPKRGWFGRTKEEPKEEEVKPDLIEEATKLILQRQEALQQEASKIMETIESIASAKSQSMQESLIEHANQRQQELAQEVEKLSEWTERLLEDRANRVEAHARATLEALDRAVVEEGRRIKLMGMTLAENTISQAEQKALEGLAALEQNAIEQVVKLASHVVESITKGGKKRNKKHSNTPVAIWQRNILGTGESSRLLVMVRSSSVFLAIILAISPSYWERMGGNTAMEAMFQGDVAWLFQKNPHSIRPLASAVCAISAILLTWRFSPAYELVAQRLGALLVCFICRVQTIDTTIMSLIAIAFLLMEQKSDRRK